MELKSDNPKALQTLNLRLKELSSKVGKVGWFESAKYEDGTPVAYVATIQEFGSPARSIPPRPFMRPAIIEHQKEWEKVAADGAKAILEGKSNVDNVMTAITSVAESQVYKNIVNLLEPKLSPLTLAIRKYKLLNPGVKITGRLVGEIAAKLKAGEIDTSGVSTKPLNDTGLMLATLTSVVEDANT